MKEARESLSEYIEWYNNKRRHSGINNHKPYEIMVGVKLASTWPFKQVPILIENEENKAYRQEKIKQQKKGTTQINLSSKIAA